MNKVYILSLSHSISNRLAICEGVWGVFDSYEKAHRAMERCIDEYEEVIHDFDANETEWFVFTNKSTWKIERLTINDEPV